MKWNKIAVALVPHAIVGTGIVLLLVWPYLGVNRKQKQSTAATEVIKQAEPSTTDTNSSQSSDEVAEKLAEIVKPLPEITEYDQVERTRIQEETDRAERLGEIRKNRHGYVYFPFRETWFLEAVEDYLNIHPELDPVPVLTFGNTQTGTTVGWTLVFREKPKQ